MLKCNLYHKIKLLNVLTSTKKSYVDEKLKTSKGFKYQKILQHYPEAQERLGFWTPELCAIQPKMFDFIVTVSL